MTTSNYNKNSSKSQVNSSPKSWKELSETSNLSGGSGEYLDLLYESFLVDHNSVPQNWQEYFSKITTGQDTLHSPVKEYFKHISKLPNKLASSRTGLTGDLSNVDMQSVEHVYRQVAVNKLVVAYRRFGHRLANLDPLNLTDKENLPILNLDYYGFTQQDLDTEFSAGSLIPTTSENLAKLSDIIKVLQKVYCNNIGYQYQYITNHEERTWLQNRIEENQGNFTISPDAKKNILEHLTAAEGLEKYLHTKYVGQKRFSLEGGESLIVLLDELIQRSGGSGYKEIVLSMAHRGRLNVLVNILGKSPTELFAEFEGTAKNNTEDSVIAASGDVKYHQGFSSDIETPGGEVHLALAYNPSHLEIVSPVSQGSVKARQERRFDLEHKKVLGITLHGDAAFAGQGVVMETFNMSMLRGFSIGGTVHIVINNQVGFTTNDLRDARSTRYCTDIAKMTEAPVFHVNADDPEAVLWVTQTALDYKHKFNKDVVIDLICYRRHGHNEADEPSATQPLMYKVIKKLKSTRDLYAEKLVAEKILTQKQDKDFINLYRDKLDQGAVVISNIIGNQQSAKGTVWQDYISNSHTEADINYVDTSIDKLKLLNLGENISTVAADFKLQAQVKKVIESRQKMTRGEKPVDWGFAEMLAYASLLEQGYGLRLCGQDTGRGTFAHRHAVLHDQNTGQVHNSLYNLKSEDKNCVVIDSILSEEAVLAFEYGYSTTDPNTLTIWEAQFGDFVNGAQVVIDQFISSCEQKWGRLSGLVMLLPHGYEGMGPEHSSARLERFLQLCADNNMQVCVPTTPSQVFHMLRRQMLRKSRKPLIVMSPKSLLRHKQAVSTIDELASGCFNLLLPEVKQSIAENPDSVTKVVLCSGKVYYDLLAKRDSDNLDNVAIVRVEQLYPFPEKELVDLLSGYKNLTKVVWCQEEPKNQGAWYCTAHHLYSCVNELNKDNNKQIELTYAGRVRSSSPAVGYYSLHLAQQNELVKQAISN